MKKLLVLLGFIAVVGSVSEANAKDRWPSWYVGLKGSTGFALNEGAGSADHEGGWGVGGVVGYLPEFGLGDADNFRIEGEIFYRENEYEDAAGYEIETTSYMLNGYYDFGKLESFPIVPYVGAGLGSTTIEVSDLDLDEDAFTWQLMGGIGFEIEEVPMVAFNVGYRFVRMEDNDAIDDAANHNIEVGVNFRF